MLSNSCYLKLFQLETEMFSSRPFLFQSKKLKQNPMCKNVIVYKPSVSSLITEFIETTGYAIILDGNLPKATFLLL